jgi:hypothetical protein
MKEKPSSGAQLDTLANPPSMENGPYQHKNMMYYAHGSYLQRMGLMVKMGRSPNQLFWPIQPNFGVKWENTLPSVL